MSSHIVAGEQIVDYLTHIGNDGLPVAGATFTVVSARKPNGSAFVPTITDIGGGTYRITIATTRTEDGQWYLLLADTAQNPDRYYDSTWDVDPAPSESSAGIGGGVTRATLRRAVGRLMGDVLVLSCTANGTTTTAIDTVSLAVENAGLTGRQLYVFQSAAGANQGLTRRVSGNTKSTATLTFTPALPSATTAGDVLELFSERGIGPGPTEIHEAINRAIEAARDSHVTQALATPVALEWSSPIVSIPSTWTFFAGAEWQDHEGLWRKVAPADLKLDAVARTVEFKNRMRWLADQQQVRLRGYLPPAALASDTEGTGVDAEWIANQAAAELWMASAHRQIDPAGAERKAQYFQGKADALRPKTRTRPQGTFMRLY